MKIDPGLISGIAAIIMSLVAIYTAVNRANSTKRDVDGNVAVRYEELANRQLTRIDEQQREIDTQRTQIEKLTKRTDELECKLDESNKTVTRLLIGIDILLKQLDANKLTPMWRLDNDVLISETNNDDNGSNGNCNQSESPLEKRKKNIRR